MKSLALLLTLAGSMIAGNAVAGPVSTLQGWGVNTGAIGVANDVAAINYAPTIPSGYSTDYVTEDSSVNGYVGPNYGGQRYDLEALYVKQFGNQLQIAGVTGALWNNRPTADGAVSGVGTEFGIGDLFIGNRIGANGNTFAGYGIELTGAFYEMNDNGNTISAKMTTAGAIYSVSSGVGYTDGLKHSRDKDSMTGPGQLVNGASESDGVGGSIDDTAEHFASILPGAATVQWEQLAGDRHSAFLVTVDLTNFSPFYSTQGNGYTVHWGEVCTNDYLETSVTVAEPLTVGLLGLGLVGLGFARRRKAA